MDGVSVYVCVGGWVGGCEWMRKDSLDKEGKKVWAARCFIYALCVCGCAVHAYNT